MKKTVCLLLALIMLISFVSCNNDDEIKKSDIDLEYNVKLGKIYESEYSIGANPDEIIEKLKTAAENSEHSHEVFDLVEGENNVLIDGGYYNYYYKKANKDKGISYIISYDTAFGFEIGTVIIEVRDAFEGISFKEEPLNEKNSFFLLGATEGTVLSTEIDKYTVSFVFVDNALCATTIYITDEWK